MTFFWIAVGLGGTVLQLVVIYQMKKGFYRTFPGVFLYLLVLFFTAVADAAAATDQVAWTGWYRPFYGFNNIARHLGGLVAVVSLYFYATSLHVRRIALRVRVFVIVGGATALSLFLNFGGTFDWDYIAKVGRDMSFITALLNLILWLALIQTRRRERVLFLVSGGLGLNMTGEATSQALNVINAALWPLASLISVGSHILCLLIWLRALKVYSLEQTAAARAEAR